MSRIRSQLCWISDPAHPVKLVETLLSGFAHTNPAQFNSPKSYHGMIVLHIGVADCYTLLEIHRRGHRSNDVTFWQETWVLEQLGHGVSGEQNQSGSVRVKYRLQYRAARRKWRPPFGK
jgi:hypothetical protein